VPCVQSHVGCSCFACTVPTVKSGAGDFDGFVRFGVILKGVEDGQELGCQGGFPVRLGCVKHQLLLHLSSQETI
jgi:hypothetical protein